MNVGLLKFNHILVCHSLVGSIYGLHISFIDVPLRPIGTSGIGEEKNTG